MERRRRHRPHPPRRNKRNRRRCRQDQACTPASTKGRPRRSHATTSPCRLTSNSRTSSWLGLPSHQLCRACPSHTTRRPLALSLTGPPRRLSSARARRRRMQRTWSERPITTTSGQRRARSRSEAPSRPTTPTRRRRSKGKGSPLNFMAQLRSAKQAT